MAEVDQRIQVCVGADPHAAAIAAIAAVRATQRDELLSAKADAAVTAVASGDLDLRFVYKFHDSGCPLMAAGELPDRKV
ncbi:hypothetical protein D3C71_1663380 [compost metagenome]